MPNDLREREVREFLRRMAGEMPTPEEIPPEATRRAHRKLARTAVVSLVLAAVALAGVLGGVRALLLAEPRPADDGGREPLVAITIAAGVPNDVAVGPGAVWVSGSGVFRIDPATDEIDASFPSTSREQGSRLAIGEGAVWVSGGAFDGEVVRIDPLTNEIVATIHTGAYEDPYAIAIGAGSVWATTHNDGALLRLDPATNTIETIQTFGVTHGLAVLDDTVWVVARETEYDDGAGEPFGVDPSTGEKVFRVPQIVYDGLWAGFGSLWGISANQVVRIDPSTGSVIASIGLGLAPDDPPDDVHIEVGEGAVWVSTTRFRQAVNAFETRILRIDPASNVPVREFRLAAKAEGIAAGAGSVWVADGVDTLYRIDPEAFTILSGSGS